MFYPKHGFSVWVFYHLHEVHGCKVGNGREQKHLPQHTHMRTLVHIHTHSCMHQCMHTCMHTCTRSHTLVHAHTRTYSCMYAHMYTHAHAYSHTCMRTHTCTHIYSHWIRFAPHGLNAPLPEHPTAHQRGRGASGEKGPGASLRRAAHSALPARSRRL